MGVEGGLDIFLIDPKPLKVKFTLYGVPTYHGATLEIAPIDPEKRSI